MGRLCPNPIIVYVFQLESVWWVGSGVTTQSSESKGWLSSCDIAQVYELLLSHPISELSNLQCTLCVRLGSAEHNNQLAAAAEKVRLSGVRGEQS